MQHINCLQALVYCISEYMKSYKEIFCQFPILGLPEQQKVSHGKNQIGGKVHDRVQGTGYPIRSAICELRFPECAEEREKCSSRMLR